MFCKTTTLLAKAFRLAGVTNKRKLILFSSKMAVPVVIRGAKVFAAPELGYIRHSLLQRKSGDETAG